MLDTSAMAAPIIVDYKTTEASVSDAACISCPDHATTNGRIGQTQLIDCFCSPGFYNAASRPDLEVDCAVCVSGTDCSRAGFTLATLPIKRGFFRLSLDTDDVCAHWNGACTQHTVAALMFLTAHVLPLQRQL